MHCRAGTSNSRERSSGRDTLDSGDAGAEDWKCIYLRVYEGKVFQISFHVSEVKAGEGDNEG